MTGINKVVRSTSTVGLYQVRWMHGVSEAMEEAITLYLLRYPTLLSPGPVRVAMSRDGMGRGRLFRTRRESHEKGSVRDLVIGRQWWETVPAQREYDFIMAMLLERLSLEGKLRVEDGELRLRQDGGILCGDSATARLNERASQLFEAYS